MAELQPFPRVLVLCDEPINRIGGGGVTMGNLFREWPPDALAQVWAHHRFEIDADVCPNYLRLGAHSIPGDGRVIPDFIKRRRDLVKRLRTFVRPGIKLDYQQVLDWARAFQPEVIYSQPTPYPMYTWWLPRWLARDLGAPLVNHVMDDWPRAVEPEWLPGVRQLLRLFLKRELDRMFAVAARNLVISEQMAAEYTNRYGHSFTSFHNAINLAEWAEPRQRYAAPEGPFRVVYLGALADNMQVLSLRDVAQVISALAEQGVPINLTVYTGEIYQDYFRQYLGGLTAVSHGGRVEREDLCCHLAAADLLVVPINFDERSLLMNQYSMPTKVPEYMASGTPVLVYGPTHVPPVAYARDAGWGYVVDQPDQQRLATALRELLSSESLRQQLGKRGRELALRNHDAQQILADFRETLSLAAQHGQAAALNQRSATSLAQREGM